MQLDDYIQIYDLRKEKIILSGTIIKVQERVERQICTLDTGIKITVMQI